MGYYYPCAVDVVEFKNPQGELVAMWGAYEYTSPDKTAEAIIAKAVRESGYEYTDPAKAREAAVSALRDAGYTGTLRVKIVDSMSFNAPVTV